MEKSTCHILLSDLCVVNKNLATETQAVIGSEWKPGQVFCNVHFTLAIAEGIKSIIRTKLVQINCFLKLLVLK